MAGPGRAAHSSLPSADEATAAVASESDGNVAGCAVLPSAVDVAGIATALPAVLADVLAALPATTVSVVVRFCCYKFGYYSNHQMFCCRFCLGPFKYSTNIVGLLMFHLFIVLMLFLLLSLLLQQYGLYYCSFFSIVY